jgi:hypothetical protein
MPNLVTLVGLNGESLYDDIFCYESNAASSVTSRDGEKIAQNVAQPHFQT